MNTAVKGVSPTSALLLPPRSRHSRLSWNVRLFLATLGLLAWYRFGGLYRLRRIIQHGPPPSPTWGSFPRLGDPFHFLPCTNRTLPPSLDHPDPRAAWSALYDANPDHWTGGERGERGDSLYLCGWLDVPLDYTNLSDPRMVRLAVTCFQHSPAASARTFVINPGGPGGSGTAWAAMDAERISQGYSDSTFDVLGWDPRGVNASQPSISCFPYNADRDRWRLLTSRFSRDVSDLRTAMATADAMNRAVFKVNRAVFKACHQKYRDVAQMMTTTFVARDLEEIRKALGEEQLTGYFISYGTAIGQIYINLFPERIGRLMLDGVEYLRDERSLGGFGWGSMGNITDAFSDGFLGECVDAGPEHCALARPRNKRDPMPTVEDLKETIDKLFIRLSHRPMPGYSGASGPMMITYSQVVSLIYANLYSPLGWDTLALALFELLQNNTTMISNMNDGLWESDPSFPPSPASTFELGQLVICSDASSSPLPSSYDPSTKGEQWYLDTWSAMVAKSEIGGDRCFLNILPCRHWNSTFGPPNEVYQGDFDAELSNQVLLIAGTYDPATPLRGGKGLAREMGENARLVMHHGYGHTSEEDRSECTKRVMSEYMRDGKVPEERETHCSADGRPYRYQGDKGGLARRRTVR